VWRGGPNEIHTTPKKFGKQIGGGGEQERSRGERARSGEGDRVPASSALGRWVERTREEVSTTVEKFRVWSDAGDDDDVEDTSSSDSGVGGDGDGHRR
jgi:hypothetical protein